MVDVAPEVSVRLGCFRVQVCGRAVRVGREISNRKSSACRGASRTGTSVRRFGHVRRVLWHNSRARWTRR